MFKTDFVDLHCDTLTHFKDLDSDGAAFSLSKLPTVGTWTQLCAIFIPDSIRGREAVDYYEKHRDIFYSECEKHSGIAAGCEKYEDIEKAVSGGKHALMLTVEGGAVLNGDIKRIEKLRHDGVRVLTLVWNGKNEIASGHDFPQEGLTDFGRKAVKALEKAGIIIDVSHLNDKGFGELCEIAEKPFIATHSNSRTVTPHRRNLPDSFVGEIVSRGGLIGINYFNDFLTSGGEKADFDDIYRHVSYLLELGAGDVLSLGSDFDGASMPEGIESAGDVVSLCSYLLSRGIDESTVRNIAYMNAMRFFKAYI